MPVFEIIGEKFSLICILLCKMTTLENFRCFLQWLWMFLQKKWLVKYFHLCLCGKNNCYSNCASIYPHAVICRNNVRKFVPVLAKNPIFRSFLPRLLDLWLILYQILRISQFFGKISSNIPSFRCILLENALIVSCYCKNPEYSGSSCRFLVKISVLISEYPNQILPIFRSNQQLNTLKIEPIGPDSPPMKGLLIY